jgi:hypothetical protein
MFSKAITLLLVATCAIGGQIKEGTYRITNVASHSTARTYNAGSEIYVSSTKENPGPYEVWDIRNAVDGGYTIENVGLKYGTPDSFAAVFAPEDGEPVVTYRKRIVFNIESAGNGKHVIKLPYDNLLWNVEPPVIPRGSIKLRPAEGLETEQWILTPTSAETHDNDDDRWYLQQRIGRFSGRTPSC